MPRANASSDSSRTSARRRGTADIPSRLNHADELMELAVDAAQSRLLPEFLERFADRAARMLCADWCGVMVFRGRETDLYQSPKNKFASDATLHTSLVRQARDLRQEVEIRPLV